MSELMFHVMSFTWCNELSHALWFAYFAALTAGCVTYLNLLHK